MGGNGSVLYLDGGDGQLPAMTNSNHRRAGETGVLTQSSSSPGELPLEFGPVL